MKYIILFLLLFVLSCSTADETFFGITEVAGSENLNESLLIYWSFDDNSTFNDTWSNLTTIETPNINDVAKLGKIHPTSASKLGDSAINFTFFKAANSSFLNVTDSAGLFNVGSNANAFFTVTMWVYPESGGNINAKIFTTEDLGFSTGWEMWVRMDDLFLRCKSENVNCNQSRDNVLNINQWNFIALTVNGTNMSLWVNDTIVKSQLVPGTSYDSNRSLKIGGLGTQNTEFNGSVDEVGVWNRTLKQFEISAVWNNDDAFNFVGPRPVVASPVISVSFPSDIGELQYAPNWSIVDMTKVFNITTIVSGNWSWNMTELGIIPVNVTNFLFNITETNDINGTVQLKMNNTQSWFNWNCTNKIINTTFQNISQINASQSLFINCTLNMINAAQVYTNFIQTTDNASFDFSRTFIVIDR